MFEPSNADLARVLRMQAWERAKGELNAMLQTYHGEQEEFSIVDGKFKSFILDFEDNHT